MRACRAGGIPGFAAGVGFPVFGAIDSSMTAVRIPMEFSNRGNIR